MPETLAIRLRQETADAHRSLENALDLLQSDITWNRYLRLLGAFHDFLQPFEQALVGALPNSLHGMAAARRHAWRARADLETLTGHPYAATPCPHMPTIPHSPAALGCMYVIEGSTLGGQIIAPHLCRRFAERGVSAARGAQYFGGYGADNGRMWRTFREALDQVPAVLHDDTVRAASATFTSLRRWLEQRGVTEGLPA
ncbi:MAG: biliverdin-producing heme oxygenase [Rhodocyclaceae bacterium]